jgi:hypothetical protein
VSARAGGAEGAGVLVFGGVLYRRSIAVPINANSVKSQANSMGMIDFFPALQLLIHSE